MTQPDPQAPTRRFYVRTYGCQMNEHDSERIAGLLAADGMEPTDDLESADVVVLNTCCIRENADNKLYGHLGRLKALKARAPRSADRGRWLPRPEGPRADRRAGRPRRRRVRHPQPRERARRCSNGPGSRAPWSRSSRSTRPTRRRFRRARRSSSLGRHSAWVTIQVGCDNSCTFCIVPIVRGPEISRRMGDIVREVEELAADGVREITVLGQNVNSYGRDLGAGQYRPQFADLLRALDAVDGIERIRFTSPHPKDLRPETIAAMAECASVCEHLHLPLQSGSDRTLARMHRGYTAERYLQRLAGARAAVPDLAVTTDLIVGFPGETDADFERTLEVVDAAAYDAAYTFVFSPRPGTPAAEHGRRLRRARGRPGSHAQAHRRRRAARAGEARGAGRAHRVVAARRPVEERRHHVVGTHAPEQAGALRPEPATRQRNRWSAAPPTVVVTYAAPHWLRGDLVQLDPAPRPVRIRIPVTAAPASCLRDGSASRDRRPHRIREVGARARGRARAYGDVEIVSIDSMQVYRGLDIGTAKPTVAERAAVAHHLVDVAEPDEEWSVARFQAEARAAVADIEARGRRALLVGGTGLYVQAVVDPLTFPPEDRAVRDAILGPDRRGGRPTPTPSSPGSTRWPRRAIEPGNARRIARALEVIEITGRPFSSFGAGLQDVRRHRVPRPHRRHLVAAYGAGRADRSEGRDHARRRSGRRGGRRSGPAARSPAPRRRPSGTGRSSATWRARSRRSTPRSRPWWCAPGGSPAASACGSGVTPASGGSGPRRIRARWLPTLLASWST